MKFGYGMIKALREELLAFMDRHGFSTLADFKGKSLDYFTTHADLVRRQRERKDAEKSAHAVKADGDWTGDKFVEQSQALSS
jgi:hypothetical protein